MLKVFGELKAGDPQLFKEVVQAAREEPGSGEFLVLRTWGELENCAAFVARHQFDIDNNKLRAQLTAAEWNFVEGMVNCTRESHKEGRKKAHKVAAQRSERFVKWYLDNNQAMKQIAKLQAKVKRRPSQSTMEQDWSNLKQQLFN